MREFASELFSFALAQTMVAIQQVVQLAAGAAQAASQPPPIEPAQLSSSTLALPPHRFESTNVAPPPQAPGWGPMP